MKSPLDSLDQPSSNRSQSTLSTNQIDIKIENDFDIIEIEEIWKDGSETNCTDPLKVEVKHEDGAIIKSKNGLLSATKGTSQQPNPQSDIKTEEEFDEEFLATSDDKSIRHESIQIGEISHRGSEAKTGAKNNPITVQKPTTSSAISTNGVDAEDEGEVITEQDILKLDLLGYLQATSEGIALLSIIKNRGQLTKSSRSRLTRLIIKRELDEALLHVDGRELNSSEFTITKRKFLIYTKSIVKIFPSELRCTYYSPYANVGGTRIAPKGKLYDNYTYSKSKLRDDGILFSSTSASLPENSAEETPILTENENDPAIDEKFQSLQTEVPTVDILRDYWKSTYQKRRDLLIKNRLSVYDYFHMFPCLSNDAYAIELLDNDFEKLLPTKAQSLTKNWPQLKKKLITLINELNNIKDIEDLALRKLIPNVTPSNQDAIIFHLIPYITGNPYIDIPEDEQIEKVGTKRKRKVTKRRTTTVENRESFFMLSATVGNIDEEIRMQKEKRIQFKRPPQPLPIFVGTLSNIIDTYVIVDNIKYRTNNPIAAIDLAFKIFHMVDCPYPEPSLFSWLLIKQFGYDLPIRESDLPIIMKVLLGDLRK